MHIEIEDGLMKEVLSTYNDQNSASLTEMEVALPHPAYISLKNALVSSSCA